MRSAAWPRNSNAIRQKAIKARSRHVCAAKSSGGAAARVQLGSSDLQVSKCCLGTMTWGQQNTEDEAHEQLSYALDAGINFIDTAEMYPVPTKAETQGRTDKYIGSWLKSQKREDIILASKVSGYGKHLTWLRDNGQHTRVTRDQILESVDKSLARLGVDYIDLLQIHFPDRYVPLFGAAGYDPALRRDYVPFEEQLSALKEVIDAGKVRYVGVSNETSFGVMEFAHCSERLGLPKMQTIQNSFSLLVRDRFETDLTEVCYEKNVSLLAYSPLAGGVLTGKYITGAASSNSRLNLFTGFMDRYNKSLARTATEAYVKVAQKHGLTPTELALAWCAGRRHVASSIIGATSLDQLKENVAAFDVKLNDDILKDVDAVYRQYRDPSMSG